MATLQTGSTADVDVCSDNELVKGENHKNEVSFKSLDGNLYYFGGGKLAVAIASCLNISFQYCILFCMQQDLRLELRFRNDLWLKILIRLIQRSRFQLFSIHQKKKSR